MKQSIRTIIGRATVVLGCCALAFAVLLACLVWGDNQPGGEFYFPLPTLDSEVRITMAISAAIGVIGVVVGMRITRAKQRLNAGPSQKQLP
jgi:hypothetical protein